MKFFRLDLLTLLISLFILNSCKNQDTIGLGVNSQNQVNGIMVDTSTIVVNTVIEDSVVTSGLTKAPLGYFQDPIFGTTESSLAASLSLPGATGYSLPSALSQSTQQGWCCAMSTVFTATRLLQIIK